MASLGAIAKRRAEAYARLTAATAEIAQAEIELPPPVPGNIAQPALREAMEVERLATIFELVLQARDSKSGGVDPAALDGSIADVKVYLESIADEASLDMLAATESARERPRAGVLAAIDKRRSGLSSETEEE